MNSRMMNIIQVFENLPTILQYFIPGYCALQLYKWERGHKQKQPVSSMVIISCVISYALISITELIFAACKKENSPIILKSGLAIILGLCVSFLLAIICDSKWFSAVTVKLCGRTPNDDIWRDVFDLREGSNIKVYLNNTNIYYVAGNFRNIEEKGEKSWLVVSPYIKMSCSNKGAIENHISDTKAMYLIRLSDVEHIEIFNNDKNK